MKIFRNGHIAGRPNASNKGKDILVLYQFLYSGLCFRGLIAVIPQKVFYLPAMYAPGLIDRFKIETDLGFIEIEQIVFEATFSTTFRLVPMSQLMEYSSNETTQPICQSVEWEIDLPNN